MGNEFALIIIMSVASILLSAGTYAQGFKDGERRGYSKGRAISRHASTQVKS
jgi:hypothetical protein